MKRNAAKWDTKASKSLLEMADEYVPTPKRKLSCKMTIDNNIGKAKVPKNAGWKETVLPNGELNQKRWKLVRK